MIDFKGKDILDGAQFTRQELEAIMSVAAEMREQLEERPALDLMKGHVLGALFFEPSTRTRLSFESAIHRLGGRLITVANASSTSMKKGEISGIVETQFGYHIIMVTDRVEPKTASLMDEKAKISLELQNQKTVCMKLSNMRIVIFLALNFILK